MGTKTFNNYEDLLTFTRASKGHALRPVSYGTELVTNGDGSSVTNWNSPRSNSTLSVNSGRLRATASASGAYGIAQTLSNLTVGAIYFYSANIYADGGSGNMIFRISALSTLDNQPVSDEQSTTRLVSGSFVATASTMYVGGIHVASSAGDYIELDNVSIKEVTFDQPDGTLTLFEHPNNIPRVEWDADRNRLGLLVEEARTNLVTSSDATGWTVAAASATDNTETTLGAFTGAVVSSNGADWHRYRPANITVTSGTTYAVTLFYEYGTSGDVLLNFRDVAGANESRVTGAWGSLIISLQNAGTLTVLEETALPQNVKKVVAKFVPNFSGNFELGIGPNSNTSGETVIVYAAQCEQASFGTSYIKTTGSSATRSADAQDIQLANFGYNHDKGTVLVEFSQDFDYGSTGFPRAFEIGDPSTERVNLFVNTSTGTLVAGANFNNLNQAGIVLEIDTDGRIDTTKVAYAFADDDFAASDDGETVVTDTSGTFSGGTPRTKLLIGPSNFCGHIKSIQYYPRRLTNAQLQALTEPRSTPTLSLTFDGLESSYTENYIHG